MATDYPNADATSEVDEYAGVVEVSLFGACDSCSDCTRRSCVAF